MVMPMVPVGPRHGRSAASAARPRHRAIAIGPLLAFVLAGCVFFPAGESSPEPRPSPPPTATAPNSTDAAPAPDATAVTVADLLADPAAFVGLQIEVTGKAFFLARCPPPGSSVTACVLQGYLAERDRGTLIAADVAEAITLAEAGELLTCEETAQTSTACGDWTDEATYRVVGVIEHQVAGGREIEAIQLNVTTRTGLD
jgi:hypothetical protein